VLEKFLGDGFLLGEMFLGDNRGYEPFLGEIRG
jgi:hypothetical protein